MQFTLNIKMNGSAFVGDEQSNPLNNGGELGRILADIARRAGDVNFTSMDAGSIFDLNGNRVGEWSVSE